MAKQRVERRLAAILAGDVAGYSRLMGADEEGTLSRFNAHRRDFLEPKIADHRGRIVKWTGDGILIEFASVIDAARCAVEIQCGMAKRNASVPHDKRIEFRIGIHVGDVIIEDGDIFGDGVNIAARLEGVARPGGVCISDDTYRYVRGKLDVVFRDAGERKLKNIALPMRVYELHTGGDPEAPPTLALPDNPSIAVLPFQNMSGDPEQEYFVDGTVDDIITGLSRVKWLFVIARNSSFTYKGRAVDVKQVGRELGVRYVLEGSVRKVGDRVRITGQLINAESGAHIWAERYDRKFDDIFALQDEITLSIVGAIEPSLRQAEVERVNRKRPENLDAYDLALRALPDVYSVMPSTVSKALVLLDQALAIEPHYASAHGYAAMCHHCLFLRGGFHEENRAASIGHAQAAIAHGRDDSTALALAGFSMAMDAHDRGAAVAAFEAALGVSPSSAPAYILGGGSLAWAGEAERTIEWAEKGLRLSPFDPWKFIAYRGLAIAHFLRSRYEEAADAARKAVQFNPGFGSSYMLLAASFAKLGRHEEAKNSVARLLEREPAFRLSKQFAGVDCAPALGAALSEALRDIGVPE
ncbi:MAG TPA: adenylate/guanylate cyclase domain-containing protein [Terriglobales bacterium]|nr:adenylate/guanylate cyclase domain-containing protein [Terriglobales bacterium]